MLWKVLSRVLLISCCIALSSVWILVEGKLVHCVSLCLVIVRGDCERNVHVYNCVIYVSVSINWGWSLQNFTLLANWGHCRAAEISAEFAGLCMPVCSITKVQYIMYALQPSWVKVRGWSWKNELWYYFTKQCCSTLDWAQVSIMGY